MFSIQTTLRINQKFQNKYSKPFLQIHSIQNIKTNSLDKRTKLNSKSINCEVKPKEKYTNRKKPSKNPQKPSKTLKNAKNPLNSKIFPKSLLFEICIEQRSEKEKERENKPEDKRK